jgi:excisionase family DNA binding protein
MTTQISLGAAARQLGISKGTISKAIASGKLSATRREDNSWAIENAELARYIEAHGHRFRPQTVPDDQTETVVQLRARAELAEQRLADLRERLADMERQRDKWETVATRLSLPAPKPERKPTLATPTLAYTPAPTLAPTPVPAPTPEPTPTSSSWSILRWLLDH